MALPHRTGGVAMSTVAVPCDRCRVMVNVTFQVRVAPADDLASFAWWCKPCLKEGDA